MELSFAGERLSLAKRGSSSAAPQGSAPAGVIRVLPPAAPSPCSATCAQKSAAPQGIQVTLLPSPATSAEPIAAKHPRGQNEEEPRDGPVSPSPGQKPTSPNILRHLSHLGGEQPFRGPLCCPCSTSFAPR